MNAIELTNIQFAYLDGRQLALRDLTLAVPDGQICAVIGRAGAGKSTLCALCAGFVPQFYQGELQGEAVVDGQNVIAQNIADLVRHVGLIGANSFSQVSGARFTVFEEVAFGLENLGIPREQIVERVESALDALGIGSLRDRSPFELSGGQQQRMVIAATLALRPPVLVLDEPTAQLDPPSVAELAELLRRLATNGTTILVAEHRLEWVAALADRVIALEQGQIIADGTPQGVFTNPLLIEREIGWPRPALIAADLRARSRLPADIPLPITEHNLLAAVEHAGADTTAQQTPELLPSAERAHVQTPIVAIEQITYAYKSGVQALRGVSLAIGPGERVALLGRNGAGKSTLARHFNGLLKPTTGQVHVGGTDVRRSTVARNARYVGVMFQDARNQLFARTVRDELRFGPRNLRYDSQRIDMLVDQALEALGLRDIANEHPYDLPLGTRRLVAIGALLAMDTPLLVLDEPTAGLDTVAVHRLKQLCHELAGAGRSVMVITHDLDFATEALERVVLMRDGQIALDSTWNNLGTAQRTIFNQTIGLPLDIRVRDALGR